MKESQEKLINWTAILLAAICAGGLGWGFGFACGGILTRPNREMVDAEIKRYQDIAAEHARARTVAEGKASELEGASGDRAGLTPVDVTVVVAAIELYECMVRAEAMQRVREAIQEKFNKDGYSDTFLCTLDGHQEELARVLAEAEGMEVPDNADVRAVHVDVVEGLAAQVEFAKVITKLYKNPGNQRMLAESRKEAVGARDAGFRAQLAVIGLWEVCCPGILRAWHVGRWDEDE